MTPIPPSPPVAGTLPDIVKEIQSALDAKPTRWDYDSNQTPFYNDADGHSRGGDNDGTYCLYGPDFFIDGEHYEGPVLTQRCGEKDAKFIAACSPENMQILLAALSAHEAEVGRLRKELGKYANVFNWDIDGQGIRRVWLEPDSTSPTAYNGFESACAALTQGETK